MPYADLSPETRRLVCSYCKPKQLQALSLVSKKASMEAEAELYSSVSVFDFADYWNRGTVLVKSCLRTLTEKARLVRSFAVKVTQRETANCDRLALNICIALGHMKNLEFMSVQTPKFIHNRHALTVIESYLKVKEIKTLKALNADEFIDYGGLYNTQGNLEIFGLYRGTDSEAFYRRFGHAFRVQKYFVEKRARSREPQSARYPLIVGIGPDPKRSQFLDLLIPHNAPCYGWNKLPLFHTRFYGTEMDQLMARDSTGIKHPVTLRGLIFVTDDLSKETLSLLPKIVEGYQKTAFCKVVRVQVQTVTANPGTTEIAYEELKDIARAMPKVLSLGVGSLNPYLYFDPLLQAEDGCEGMACVLGTASAVTFGFMDWGSTYCKDWERAQML